MTRMPRFVLMLVMFALAEQAMAAPVTVTPGSPAGYKYFPRLITPGP